MSTYLTPGHLLAEVPGHLGYYPDESLIITLTRWDLVETTIVQAQRIPLVNLERFDVQVLEKAMSVLRETADEFSGDVLVVHAFTCGQANGARRHLTTLKALVKRNHIGWGGAFDVYALLAGVPLKPYGEPLNSRKVAARSEYTIADFEFSESMRARRKAGLPMLGKVSDIRRKYLEAPDPKRAAGARNLFLRQEKDWDHAYKGRMFQRLSDQARGILVTLTASSLVEIQAVQLLTDLNDIATAMYLIEEISRWWDYQEVLGDLEEAARFALQIAPDGHDRTALIALLILIAIERGDDDTVHALRVVITESGIDKNPMLAVIMGTYTYRGAELVRELLRKTVAEMKQLGRCEQ